MVNVALVQLAVNGSEPVPARIERTLGLVAQASADTDLVLLPELWPTGAFDVELGMANAMPMDNPLVAALADAAARHGIWLHGGSFLEQGENGEYFNTSVLFDPAGNLAARYRKIHLFGFDVGEAALLTAGSELVVVETPLGMTGLATCYDLRFPEMFRALTDRGATAVLLTSGWPVRRVAHWSLLARARAIENQLWLAGCNETGSHNGAELGGRSVVVDPWGEAIAEAGAGEEILRAVIDPTVPEQVRAKFPVLRDRRL